MADPYIDSTLEKKEKYRQLYSIVKLGLDNEKNLIANLANLSAHLKVAFNFLWVGFYLRESDHHLVLGPFQGKPACTKIPYGVGVCGTAWKNDQSLIVADVNNFATHIVCDSNSKSELVVPLYNGRREIIGMLDVDSEHLDYFSQEDQDYLESIVLLFSLYF